MQGVLSTAGQAVHWAKSVQLLQACLLGPNKLTAGFPMDTLEKL